MRILGIDPGTAIVGYSILDFKENKYNLIKYGCIYTSKDLPMEDRLLQIFNELEEIINEYSPKFMAVEELFFFKNNKTVISVGQARGVIILAGKKNGLQIENYTPLQVKMGITGYGKADKKQVQLMVQKILKLDEIPKPDDAADAIAVAITHINSLTNTLYSSKPVTTIKVEKEIKTNRMTAKEFRELLMNK
ncbi:crossover junction endodeoxyribonuclease RuvC [Cetobacterium sp. 8H]|uniref:crossover junction endodeoxyribonuclease RuvC n=1 Tax=Cetobacterium sp. 8H TaxID=2759681 RepID=UPI00163D06E8|nr:crossover junction endodeoxyribonuclease RuvC [Cetobacterium sp. 8H]MBC2851364.1 crossover junction endodeoxyribonuclease RuvC [Cetobacterium sp. 8H]